jgi:hypothetical protein
MRARPIILVAFLLTVAAAGCSDSLPPFDTRPKEAPPSVHEDFSRIGVCYNSFTATQEKVLAVARANCDPGTTPYLLSHDTDLTCPLLMPERATFACLKPGTPPPVKR